MKQLRRIARYPRMVLSAFYLEGVETTKMLHIFLREGRGRLHIASKYKNPTPEELHQAMEQLKDLPRFLPFFVIIIAPVPGVTEGYALIAIALEKWMGHKVQLLPTQFKKVFFEKEKAVS